MKHNDIKLIATDIDDTFLPRREQVPKRNHDAILMAQGRGIKVCGSTGRNFQQAKNIVVEMGFNEFCIVNNGASIIEIHTGKHRYRNRVEPSMIEGILKIGVSLNMSFFVCSAFEAFVAKDALAPWMMEDESVKHIKSGELLRPGTRIFDTTEEVLEACYGVTERINLDCHADEFDFETLKKAVKEKYDVEVTSSYSSGAEVTAKHATKGEAVKVLADIYGIDKENVMAVGDNLNDISMLEWAGLGVAVGNAEEQVKQRADYITLPSIEGGLGYAIEKFALGMHPDEK